MDLKHITIKKFLKENSMKKIVKKILRNFKKHKCSDNGKLLGYTKGTYKDGDTIIYSSKLKCTICGKTWVENNEIGL